MECVNNERQATLRFERSELLEDIKGGAWVEWETMKRDSEQEKHLVADIAEAGNIERVTRVLDLTFAHVVELCLPYAKMELRRSRNTRDNSYEEETEYVMQMTVPATFSETTLTLVEKLVHDMMVSSVLADWLGMTKPESAEKWAARTAALEEQIVAALSHRCRPIRRKLSPF